MWLGKARMVRVCTVSNLESYRVNLGSEVSGIHRGNKNIPDGMKLKSRTASAADLLDFTF